MSGLLLGICLLPASSSSCSRGLSRRLRCFARVMGGNIYIYMFVCCIYYTVNDIMCAWFNIGKHCLSSVSSKIFQAPAQLVPASHKPGMGASNQSTSSCSCENCRSCFHSMWVDWGGMSKSKGSSNQQRKVILMLIVFPETVFLWECMCFA